MKQIFLSFLITLCSFGVYAQNITLDGRVTDENGAPLEGVTIKLKGANNGTQTSKLYMDQTGLVKFDNGSTPITAFEVYPNGVLTAGKKQIIKFLFYTIWVPLTLQDLQHIFMVWVSTLILLDFRFQQLAQPSNFMLDHR